MEPVDSRWPSQCWRRPLTHIKPSKCIPLSPLLNQAYSCSSCFDEVCSRCSTVGDGVSIPDNVRINEEPVCAEPPLGATAPSDGTTVASITLKKGYFRTSNKSHDILQCYRKRACQGGSDADQYCAPGYFGPCEKAFICGCFRCNVR